MAIPRDDDKPTISQIVKAVTMPTQIYMIFAQYYVGNHRLAYASEKFRNAFGRLFQAFAANLCPRVIDTIADRLNITGFQASESIKGNEKADDSLADDAWRDIWRFN